MTTLFRTILPVGGLVAAALISAGCGHSDSSPAPSTTAYAFATTPSTSYAQIDRVGMPAVNTAVITSKDAYNAATPSDDSSGLFVGQITTDVGNLHTLLDTALTNAGVHPATTSVSVTQAAPLIVPDTLKIDTTAPAGFPNGRLLPDPVVDITLAVVLLDISSTGHVDTASTLANLPLNPPHNDKAFLTTFPYLAAPF